MKNYTFLILLFLTLLSTRCTGQGDEDPLDVFREIAYNALPSNVKSTVVGDWRDAEVNAWVDGFFLVVFETTDQAFRFTNTLASFIYVSN